MRSPCSFNLTSSASPARTSTGFPSSAIAASSRPIRLRENETSILSGIMQTNKIVSDSGLPWTSTEPGIGIFNGRRNHKHSRNRIAYPRDAARIALAPARCPRPLCRTRRALHGPRWADWRPARRGSALPPARGWPRTRIRRWPARSGPWNGKSACGATAVTASAAAPRATAAAA